MRTVLWTFLAIVALLTVPISFPRSEPATITGAQIFAAIALYPCIFVAGLGVLLSLIDFFCSSVSRTSAVGMLLLSLVLPSSFVLRKAMFESRYDASYAWFDQVGGPGSLNFYLHEYVAKHPQSVSYPSSDSEEVEIKGFLDYLRGKVSLNMPDHSGRVRKMKIKDDGIYTMWGTRIYFAIDRNQDGYVDAAGQRASTLYGYANPYADRPDYKPGFASAVFISLPDRVVKDTDSSMVTLDTETYKRLAPGVLKDEK
jgi:hypothetical protein